MGLVCDAMMDRSKFNGIEFHVDPEITPRRELALMELVKSYTLKYFAERPE